jgi:hypothetical protein
MSYVTALSGLVTVHIHSKTAGPMRLSGAFRQIVAGEVIRWWR